jgi:hypothetical protein
MRTYVSRNETDDITRLSTNEAINETCSVTNRVSMNGVGFLVTGSYTHWIEH